MYLIYIGIGILALGIIAVVWILTADRKSSTAQPKTNSEQQALTTSQILNQLGLNEEDQDPEPSPLPKSAGTSASEESSPDNVFADKMGAEEILNDETAGLPPSHRGTAALRLDDDENSESEKILVMENEQIKKQIEDVRTKNEKLESILQDKNKDIEQVKNDLETELKSRKEFNKIKDILEKELKDSKEKNRALQIDLNNTQTEADSFLKRVKQLEEKIKKLEGEVEEKDGVLKTHQAVNEKDKKNLDRLEKNLKEFDPLIREKDQKINSLVPLLKDLPEGTPAATPAGDEEKPKEGETAGSPETDAPLTKPHSEKGGEGEQPPTQEQVQKGADTSAPDASQEKTQAPGSVKETDKNKGEEKAAPPTASEAQIHPEIKKIDDIEKIRKLTETDNSPKTATPQPLFESQDVSEPAVAPPSAAPGSGRTESPDDAQNHKTDMTHKDLLNTIEADIKNGQKDTPPPGAENRANEDDPPDNTNKSMLQEQMHGDKKTEQPSKDTDRALHLPPDIDQQPKRGTEGDGIIKDNLNTEKKEEDIKQNSPVEQKEEPKEK